MSKIEKNIPIPTSDRKGSTKYNWNEFEVGDSILFENPEEGRKAHSAAYNWATQHNKKFIYRMVENRKIRIWRIK